MIDKMNNFIQIINEMFILVATWSLFLFTNYVPDAERRYDYGRAFLYFLAVNFGLNFVCLVWTLGGSIVRGVNGYFKRKAYKRRV